jgi:transposase
MNGLAIKNLPDDPVTLKALLLDAFTKIAKYEEERRLDRARRFGASSEAGDHQANLFDEAEVNIEVVDEGAVEDDSIEVAAHTKRRPKRKPLPADLPRVDIHHDLEPADKV